MVVMTFKTTSPLWVKYIIVIFVMNYGILHDIYLRLTGQDKLSKIDRVMNAFKRELELRNKDGSDNA